MSIERSIYFKGSAQIPYKLVKSEQVFIVKTLPKYDSTNILKEAIGNDFFEQKIKLISRFDDSNAKVYQLDGTKEQLQEIKQKVRDKFENQIEYIGSTLEYQNTNAYQIYTGNIYLEFEDLCSSSFCLTVIEEHNLTNKSKLNFGLKCFFCRPKTSLGIEIFNFCETLLEIPGVKCCHPELVTELRSQKSLEVIYNTKADEKFLNSLKEDWWLEQSFIKNAWKKSKGNNTIIAVIDDGIELDHKAFKNKILAPIDMKTAKKNGLPIHNPNDKHGTPVASIACSADPEAMGVAPNAKLIPIRITGLGSVLQSEAIYWAVKNQADIICCPWGPPDGDIFDDSDNEYFYPLPDHTKKAFEYAAKYGRNGKGCIIVFAAGNGNEPARFDGYISAKEVIAVTSSNYKNQRSKYADYGKPISCSFPSGDFYLNSKNEIVFRTGVKVADRLGEPGYSEGDYFSFFTGTSASCPGAAGVFSLMLSANPKLTAKQIKNNIPKICDRIGDSEYDSSGYSNDYGYGRLNAERAVNLALQLKNSNKIKNMENAISLHIGINYVDLNYYDPIIPILSGCVNDMNRMEKFAKGLNFTTYTLENEEATQSNILNQIKSLGNQVAPGGIFLVSYAGHGVQLRDDSVRVGNEKGDEEDGQDESWVTYDGFVLDDEIYNALAAIKNEIRVLFISDSCHSETMTREIDLASNGFKERGIDWTTADYILRKNGTSVKELLSKSPKRTKGSKAIVINLSACQSDQTAKEFDNAGVFTEALLDTYYLFKNSGLYVSYPAFIDEIKKKVNETIENKRKELRRKITGQTPNYSTSHRKNNSFLNQFPFLLNPIYSGSEPQPTPNPKSDQVTNIPNPINEFDKPLFYNADSLLIETEGSEELSIPVSLSSRNLSYDKVVKVARGIVEAEELRGKTDWDKAYNLLLANQDKNISFIEPDTVSNMYEVEDGNAFTRSIGDYLETYPDAEYFNDPNYFTWHLDDNHSQLKSANQAVFPEIELGNENTNQEHLVKIAHIDTGFLENHPTIPVNMDDSHVHIKNGKTKKGAVDKDKKLAVAEQQGHGTATMAILAGNWVDLEDTNGLYKGFFGAIPYAKVLTIKISETVALLSGRNFAKAIDYAIDQGCDVITMSMAGLPSKAMAKAVNRAYRNGVVIVSAASNSFTKGGKRLLPKRTLYPARYDRVIAATGAAYNQKPYLIEYQTDWKIANRAAGGTYMQTCYGPKHVLPTTVAGYTPNIMWFSEMKNNTDGSSSYFVKSGGGTSSATPQVAAAAALYIQKYYQQLSTYKGSNAWKKAEIVRQALFRSADDSTDYNFVYGNGIVKALDALEPQFAPAKMNNVISKANKAPERQRFLGGFFGAILNRSISIPSNKDIREVLEDMMITEISQLLHKDETLFKYLDEINFEVDEFSLGDNEDLVKDILKSKHASDFLKQNLFVDSQGNNNLEMLNLEYNNVSIGEGMGRVSINTTKMVYELSNRKSYQETLGNNSVWVDEFEIDVSNSSSTRGELSPQIEITVDDHITGEDTDAVMLITKTYDEGTVYEWKFPDSLDSSIKKRGIADNRKNVFTLSVNDINTSGNRGLWEKLKKVAVKIYKWVKPKVKANPKLVNKLLTNLGDSRYNVMVFDLEQSNAEDRGWINIKLLDEKHIYKDIQADKKPLLLLLPGLFSNVESGFNMFLELPSARKGLLKSNCRYALGINMPTVVHGIQPNAEEINKILEGNLKHKISNVLARSRGGIVARYLFEDLWINNSTRKATTKAPLVLNKLIMYGTPNQGTMMASSKNWKSMLNLVTNVSRLTLGTIVPIIPKLLSISKAISLRIIDLPGIDDLEEKSTVLSRLNMLKLNRDNYYVFTSNYEPNRKLLKRLFDEFIIDRAIFKRQFNDSVTPVKGAVFQNSKLNTIISLKKSQYYIASPDEQVSHFGYLHPKHQQIIDATFKVLS